MTSTERRGKPALPVDERATMSAPTAVGGVDDAERGAPTRARSFLITNGSSTLRAADAMLSSPASASVAQSQVCARTNAKPSRISRQAERSRPALERPRRQQQRRRGRHDERRRVDEERRPRARDRDHARPRPPGRQAGERAHELVERVRLREQLARDDLGHDRAERRREERVAEAGRGDAHGELPELEVAGDRERTARCRARPRARRRPAIIIFRRSIRSVSTPPSKEEERRAAPCSAAQIHPSAEGLFESS